ncbi:IS1096 element passenger TnpR family protein [Solitalea koreensis]|uniref:PRiA4b ORF-3-like protein n=1 Tax=Solitalea koreensis TaxID=543615 RepID=A0A521DRP9_9SPHI|nr:plasmid pRiA4b ORF-3 family protein [Solitalea koreensis]SMO74386.1 pRiA4b ORF-3-like protein [Solitalea koreensis]
MAIYRFKVSFDDYDVVREIDIKSNQTFEEFHYAIHKAINFNPENSSSFYVSNDHWIKGEEIAFLPSERKIENGIKLMKDVKLSKFIDDPHQKFYYVSNFEKPFDFHVQLIKISLEADPNIDYPVCVRATGDAPKQFRITAPAAGTSAIDSVADEFDIEEPGELDVFGIDVEDLSAHTETSEDDENPESEESADGEDEFGDMGYGDGDEEYGNNRDDY